MTTLPENTGSRHGAHMTAYNLCYPSFSRVKVLSLTLQRSASAWCTAIRASTNIPKMRKKEKIRSKWAKKKEKEEEEREKEMGRGREEVLIFLINLINCEQLYMNSETYKKWQVHFYILVDDLYTIFFLPEVLLILYL